MEIKTLKLTTKIPVRLRISFSEVMIIAIHDNIRVLFTETSQLTINECTR